MSKSGMSYDRGVAMSLLSGGVINPLAALGDAPVDIPGPTIGHLSTTPGIGGVLVWVPFFRGPLKPRRLLT